MVGTMTHNYDAVVIGAGPAGCAAAAVLAEHGHRVALLEKRPLPRYHIGESMIPHCWYPLHRLGLVEELNRGAFSVRKDSVQFVSTTGKVATPFYFFQHSDHPSSRTWQVLRSEFDRMLLDRALHLGAVLHAETAATGLLRDQRHVIGVTASERGGKARRFKAPITIDASGRDSFGQLENGWRVADPVLRKMAIWTYYRGALRDPGLDEGATTVAYLPGKGWFWYIPLVDDQVSVGVVAERDYLYRDAAMRDTAAIFAREAALQPWIAEHLLPGQVCAEYRVTSEFSYRARHCAEDGLLLIGDAFAFLDPVFSSGIYLALESGVMAGDCVHEALVAGDVSASRFSAYGEDLCRQIESMRRLVYAFYDERFSFAKFFMAHPEQREAVTDCLIGNLRRDFDPLFAAMREFAEIPERLSHGRPLASGTRTTHPA